MDVGKNSWAVKRVRMAFHHAFHVLRDTVRVLSDLPVRMPENLTAAVATADADTEEIIPPTQQQLHGSILSSIIAVDDLLRRRASSSA